MELLIQIAIFVISFLLIIRGGDAFVDAALSIGRKIGISTLVLGATIVSLTTTLPELFVSTFASAEGHVDMAIGNAIGSIICNTGLILGLCAVLSPMALNGASQVKKAALLLFSIVTILVMTFFGAIHWYEGLILYCILGAYVLMNLKEARSAPPEETGENDYSGKTPVKFALGAAAIVLGSRLLVNSASAIAEMLHVPEKLIALSLVALGTSLPELVTSLTAIRKKEAGLSIGNIIGANILNIVLVMATSSLFAKGGLTTSVAESGVLAGLDQLQVLDLPVALLMGMVLLFCAMRKKVTRGTGIALLGVYAGYLGFVAYATL